MRAGTGKPCPRLGGGRTDDVDGLLAPLQAIFGAQAVNRSITASPRPSDGHSGRLVQARHNVTEQDDTAIATWLGDTSRKRRGGVAWPSFSANFESGSQYVLTDSPTNDYCGGGDHARSDP